MRVDYKKVLDRIINDNYFYYFMDYDIEIYFKISYYDKYEDHIVYAHGVRLLKLNENILLDKFPVKVSELKNLKSIFNKKISEVKKELIAMRKDFPVSDIYNTYFNRYVKRQLKDKY